MLTILGILLYAYQLSLSDVIGMQLKPLFQSYKLSTNPLNVAHECSLDEVQPNQVNTLLNQDGAQFSLFHNIWLIHSKNESRTVQEYFLKNYLRIGLNAQIFFIKSFSNASNEITQIIGKGTTEINYNVSTYTHFQDSL